MSRVVLVKPTVTASGKSSPWSTVVLVRMSVTAYESREATMAVA